MPARHAARKGPLLSLPFILLCLLLGVLWFAGGASRADALGQVVVRAASWAALIVLILFGARLSIEDSRPALLLLAAAAMLALVQLIPLPPALWQALPGRTMFLEAASLSGQVQPWRPWSIVPSATLNALSSLIVPAASLALLAGLAPHERDRLPALMLGLIGASALMGLIQLSGAGVNNPMINDTSGEVSGTFANRNHFALLLAIGCCVIPVWVFKDGRPFSWRSVVGLGLVPLFVLLILGTGSRAGLVLAIIALGFATFFVWQGLKRKLGRMPRWVFPTSAVAFIGIIAIFVLVSFSADRAASISRVLASEASDMRSRGFPTVWAMVWTYFPFGSGLGGFDPIFRIHEPFELLKYTYFNHAHNDVLELVLDAGAPGLLLLLCAIGWWAFASARAWAQAYRGGAKEPALGSAILLLVLVASLVDYPARTPLIMTVMIWAVWWLGGRAERSAHHALPASRQHL